MKILTGEAIHEADRETMRREPVESIDLMERAAEVIAQWICQNVDMSERLWFVVGKGGNGGDGLAVARMLFNAGYNCAVYMAYDKGRLGGDCRFNFDRLPRGLKPLKFEDMPGSFDGVVIDALFGSGIRGKVDEASTRMIDRINSLGARVISIDMPSGLPTEFAGSDPVCVKAGITLAIEFPKLSLLLPESGETAGRVVVLPIDLDRAYIDSVDSGFEYVDEAFVRKLMLPRAMFSNKGTYGHAMLVCGSEGMIGAALLSTGAALRSGCGLVSVHLPQSAAMAVHISHPSAMVSGDPAGCLSVMPKGIGRCNAVGVGPGIGQDGASVAVLRELLRSGKVLVLDADAINIISSHRELLDELPAGALLTPHPGELRRLVGEWADDRTKLVMVREFAARTGCYVLVKGAHSMLVSPKGMAYFNSTGCSGMAKGGSGDVLTGYITGLVARGYGIGEAGVVGMYVHGLAGEKAAAYFGEEGMNSSDIVDFLGEVMAGLA